MVLGYVWSPGLKTVNQGAMVRQMGGADVVTGALSTVWPRARWGAFPLSRMLAYHARYGPLYPWRGPLCQPRGLARVPELPGNRQGGAGLQTVDHLFGAQHVSEEKHPVLQCARVLFRGDR